MLLTLVLAAAAGWAVTRFEPILEQVLESALKEKVTLEARDFRVLSLLLLLGLAAAVASAAGADTSAFAAALGAGLGYFGPALYKLIRNPNDVPDDARWDGRMREPGARRVRRAHSPDPQPEPEPDDEETLRAVSDALKDRTPPDSTDKEPRP